MSVINRVDERTYLELATNDPDGFWELWNGEPREKPGMSLEHNVYSFELAYVVRQQVDPAIHLVRVNAPRIRRDPTGYFIPDVAVVPVELGRELRQHPGRLEIYDAPLPFIVEVWSQSTGDYDVRTKLLAYQQRGDLEIWALHPYERQLRRWVRREDGGYDEEILSGGRVELVGVPGVVVDLDALFAM